MLAAAFVGYLAFCVSHAWGCGSKRQRAGAAGGGRRMPGLAVGVLGLVLIAAGWIDDHQLVRREGVIAGDSFQVVRNSLPRWPRAVSPCAWTGRRRCM